METDEMDEDVHVNIDALELDEAIQISATDVIVNDIGETGSESGSKTKSESEGDSLRKQNLQDSTTRDIFKLILSGNHVELENYFADMGDKVKITPKIGCSPEHYSKSNPANYDMNGNEDSPLILAAKVDYKMVVIVIEYGGDPNHINKNGESPLSIAAYQGEKDNINILLWAGANLTAVVNTMTYTLTIKSEKQRNKYIVGNGGFSVRPLSVLLAKDVYLKCRYPIKTAFDVSKEIERVKDVRAEYKIEFELLIEEANFFAYSFLDKCDRMFEARKLLTSSINLLQTATDRRKKKFVSHPFCQQIINERWYGETYHKSTLFGKTMLTVRYIASPIMLPLLFLKFVLFDMWKCVPFWKSNFSDLYRFILTPCLRWTTDALNYLGFLALLINVLFTPKDPYDVIPIEYMLYYSVFARILIEADRLLQQKWQKYFGIFWNYVDITVIGLLVAAGIYKGLIKTWMAPIMKELRHNEPLIKVNETAMDELKHNKAMNETCENYLSKHDDSMNVNFYYSITVFILTIRLLSLLEIHQSLGTMIIALKYLVVDVLKFSMIFLAVILGSSVSIYAITFAKNNWEKEINELIGINSNFTDHCKDNYIRWNVKVKEMESFGTFFKTMRNMLWSTFGNIDTKVGFF